jgi:hypothetical protein
MVPFVMDGALLAPLAVLLIVFASGLNRMRAWTITAIARLSTSLRPYRGDR